MGRLRSKVTDCLCKEYDRRLKEQFRNGIDDKSIIAEIIKEIMALKDSSEVRMFIVVPEGRGTESTKDSGCGQWILGM